MLVVLFSIFISMTFEVFWFPDNSVLVTSHGCFDTAVQRVIGEPVASGLVLDESWLWHPDFETAAKQVALLVSFFF